MNIVFGCRYMSILRILFWPMIELICTVLRLERFLGTYKRESMKILH